MFQNISQSDEQKWSTKITFASKTDEYNQVLTESNEILAEESNKTNNKNMEQDEEPTMNVDVSGMKDQVSAILSTKLVKFLQFKFKNIRNSKIIMNHLKQKHARIILKIL